MPRQKMRNAFFTILYPGLFPQADLSEAERRDCTSIAIADDGEFTSICTKDGCAVFYTAQELRQLAETLYEAADLFDEAKAHPKEHDR